MNKWIRRLLIKASIKSRTMKELAPSFREDFRGLEGYVDRISYMKKFASEAVQPAMTDEEARIVRDEVVNLFRVCLLDFHDAVSENADLMDRTYRTFEQLGD